MDANRTNGTRANGAGSTQANGVGCDPNPEVLPPYVEAAPNEAAFRIGQVEFSHQTITRSPCFWILVGVGLTLIANHCMNSKRG